MFYKYWYLKCTSVNKRPVYSILLELFVDIWLVKTVPCDIEQIIMFLYHISLFWNSQDLARIISYEHEWMNESINQSRDVLKAFFVNKYGKRSKRPDYRVFITPSNFYSFLLNFAESFFPLAYDLLLTLHWICVRLFLRLWS